MQLLCETNFAALLALSLRKGKQDKTSTPKCISSNFWGEKEK